MPSQSPRTRTVTRLSVTLERIEETYPSAPFPAARKIIVVEGHEVSDSVFPPARPLAKVTSNVVQLRRAGAR